MIAPLREKLAPVYFESRQASRIMRTYLAVTFWGEEYRRYFLDFCLASLLAPGNIPALTDKTAARLLIATNDRDWAALQSEPTFVAAKKLIAIEQVPFENAAYFSAHEKMLVMSEAHRRLARRMFEDRAHGIFIYPDMIAATGFIGKLEELSRNGAAVVMFMNVRFANEGLISEIKEQGLVRPGEPMAMSSNELVRLTLRHMHSEMIRSGFDNDYADYGCSSYFWPVATGEDLLFHCGSWIPSLIDYGCIDKHDDSTFQSCTLDGDYVAKNLTNSGNVHFVRDTTELFMISFTPEATVHYSLAPRLRYRIPAFRTALKVREAHSFLYRQAPMDWLVREQFHLPVRFCGGTASQSQWRRVEGHAAGIVARIAQGGNVSDRIIHSSYLLCRGWPLLCYGSPRRGWSRPGWPRRCMRYGRELWTHRRTIARRINQMLHGDRVAWRRVAWRFQQAAGDIILGRPPREPQPHSYYSWPASRVDPMLSATTDS
jgi:hypothetical protein